MKRSDTKDFIVLIEGNESTVIVATYNRLKCNWKFRDESISLHATSKTLDNIDDFKSKKELMKRVQASTELRHIIDHLSIAWVDYGEILGIVNMSAEEVQGLYSSENAFRHNSLFYIEKARLLIETYADKPDGRFNSKELKKNLNLVYV